MCVCGSLLDALTEDRILVEAFSIFTLFLRRLKVCDITEEVIGTQGGGSGTVLIKFGEEKASSQG